MQWSRTAACLAALMMVPVATADWASFHGDAQNTGHVADSDYEVYKAVWWNNKTEDDAQITASPVLKDGKLIVADSNGLVRALDAESGTELWRYETSGVVGTPAIEGERVFVAGGSKLVALNLLDGRVEATASVGATKAGITVDRGNVFIGNEAGVMHSFTDDLTLNWKFTVTTARTEADENPTTGDWTCSGDKHGAGAIRGAPLIYEGKVFFAARNFYVYALDITGNPDGTTDIAWVYEADGRFETSPTLSRHSRGDDYIVIGNDDGHVYRLTPTLADEFENPCFGTRHPTANRYIIQEEDDDIPDDQPVGVFSSAAAAGDLVYFGANNGHLYALDSRNMDMVWEQEDIGDELNKITSSPAVANGIVVVGSENNNVYWLDANDGSILKEFATGSAIETSPAIDGARAFIAAKGGTVYMFGPELPPRPDLVATSITATVERVQVTVENQGEGDAESNGTVRIFLGGNLLADVPFGVLAAGATEIVEHRQDFPEEANEFRAVVDWGKDVVEEDEANNELTTTVDLSPEEPEVIEPGNGDGDGDGNGGGDEGIPGPGVGLLLAGLAAVAFLRRRR